MNYYLLVYDRARGELIAGPDEYTRDQRDEAVRERFRLEQHNRLNPSVEVVLLGAESVLDLTRTHSRYFKSLREIAST